MTLYSDPPVRVAGGPDRDDRDLYPSFIPARRIAESDRHHTAAGELFFMLRDRYRDKPDVYVAGNLYIYYREGDPKSMVSPDVFVAFGVPSSPRHTYKLWAEPAGPAVVFELLSESTRRKDLGRNKVLYAQLGVDEYFIYDPEWDFLAPPLQGFRLQAGGEAQPIPPDGQYQPIPPDAEGALVSERLGLRVYLDGWQLGLADVQTGVALLRPSEAQAAIRLLDAERAAAEAERAAADAEIAQLREEITRLRGGGNGSRQG
jgi:Uma2 family endonuclease